MPRPIYEVKAEFFKTLGHAARIRVLELLAEGPKSVSALQPEVGIEASHLSQQLAILRRAGMVSSSRRGNSMIYSVTNPEIYELLGMAKSIISQSLEGAGDLLADLETVNFEPGAPAS